MSDRRVGSSNARNVLLSAASASRCSTLTRPVTLNAKAAASVAAVRTWVPISSRRRFTRSARTPPKSWKTTSGTPWARPR